MFICHLKCHNYTNLGLVSSCHSQVTSASRQLQVQVPSVDLKVLVSVTLFRCHISCDNCQVQRVGFKMHSSICQVLSLKLNCQIKFIIWNMRAPKTRMLDNQGLVRQTRPYKKVRQFGQNAYFGQTDFF